MARKMTFKAVPTKDDLADPRHFIDQMMRYFRKEHAMQPDILLCSPYAYNLIRQFLIQNGSPHLGLEYFYRWDNMKMIPDQSILDDSLTLELF